MVESEAITSAEYKRANIPESIPPIENKSGFKPMWKALAKSHYKVNWDAAIYKSSGRLRASIVV